MERPFPLLSPLLEEIRLLKISPGRGEEVVTCDLLVADLDHHPVYETLSYTWGVDAGHSTIVVGNVGVPVQQNLAEALYYLRLPNASRILWVDAVCIDQMNKEEKTRQVGMMRRIYGQCSQCLIWLGGSPRAGYSTTDLQPDEVSAAFDLIRFISVYHGYGGSPSGRLPASLATPHRRAGAGKAMLRVMASGNPWWHRIWTIQEAILPALKTLVWRTQSIPWETCLQAARVLVEESNDLLLELLEQDIISVLYDNLNFITPMLSLALTTDEALDRPLHTVQRWRIRGATDPLDKLYGLMGLFSPDALPRITCDYALTPADVFTKLTLDLIDTESSLLPLCGMRGEKHATPNLPTWALDLVRPEVLINSGCIFWEQADRYRYFNADNREETPFNLEPSPDEHILALRGLHIDTIQVVDAGIAVDETVPLPTTTFTDLLLRRKQLLNNFITEAQLSIHPDGTPFDEAFWRTMQGDVILTSQRVERRATTSDAALFQAFLDTGEANESEETIRSMAVNQDFFITRNGYIGIGPPGLKAGDEAWVVHGSNVPLLLRARSGGLSGWELLGDGFVHGVMDGEFVRASTAEWVDVSLC